MAQGDADMGRATRGALEAEGLPGRYTQQRLESRRMWFPRRRQRPRHDLAALDRLSETTARAVALIEERVASAPAPPKPRPTGDLVIRTETRWSEAAPRLRERGRERDDEPEQRAQPAPVAVAEPEPTPTPVVPVLAASLPTLPSGFVLFVPTPAGYRLAGPDGLVPKPGERLRVDEDWYRVLRLGPSPLPGDRRRCVFLEATLE